MSYSVPRRLPANRSVHGVSCRFHQRLLWEQTVASILETLRASRPDGNFTSTDKLRLVLVFYLSSPDNAISSADIQELEKELKNSGADVSAFEYVRRTREISRMTLSSASVGTNTPVAGGQGGELFKGFSALGNRVCISLDQNQIYWY